MSRHKTIEDLAQKSQVSVSTIDRILSGRGAVKPSTMEHVLTVAEQIGFYGTETIRNRLLGGAPERRFGFLLNSSNRHLYRSLATELVALVKKSVAVRGHVVIRHLDDTDPDLAASALLELGRECDIIACVCVDHPAVSGAVGELALKGIPVIAMISDISSPARAGFVGSNDWQLGRTAGWFASRLAKPGRAAVLVGSERYTCQQVHEASFRSFIRADCPDLRLTGTRATNESDDIAKTVILTLLKDVPDLTVLFVAGGGIDGICDGLAQAGREDIVVIGCEMTDNTRSLISLGVISVILAHPVGEIARQAVEAMIGLSLDPPVEPHAVQVTVPFSVVVSENC
ncbi:substrate-binding domain-containing protein [Neorhizobium alkalisoli]|uniref:substrate-binding domain-containing protein n=1 Tax=Neorhizobium alkalisoli TaxID=528178 RepID=UPI0011A04A37|nr:substrate-binding domain-containing protein [Neorhizobium alkalisoli]